MYVPVADGAVKRTGHVARHHAEVTDDGDALAGHGLDDEEAGGAVDGTGPDFQGAESHADRLLRRGQPVRGGAGKEAVRRRGDKVGQTRLRLGTVEAAAHEIHPGFFRGGGFFAGAQALSFFSFALGTDLFRTRAALSLVVDQDFGLNHGLGFEFFEKGFLRGRGERLPFSKSRVFGLHLGFRNQR